MNRLGLVRTRVRKSIYRNKCYTIAIKLYNFKTKKMIWRQNSDKMIYCGFFLHFIEDWEAVLIDLTLVLIFGIGIGVK